MADYDVAIIGGGIHGVGIAQAAAAAGYSVLCLEEKEWGGATSSRSSKLIHGGLRYLQTGQLNLVRRCLNERDRLLKLAPDLVKLRSFYIPVYDGGRYSATQIRWALRAYYLLTGLRETGLYSELPPARWSEIKGLQPDGLTHIFRYYDGQTDDQALTHAVGESAQRLGAALCCPARFDAATRSESGYEVTYYETVKKQRASCRVLVNAAGPWVNQVLNQIETPTTGWRPLTIDLVQGTHLVYPAGLSEQCLYVEAPSDGRAVFILPWQDKTLVGTTERVYQGDPDDVTPLQGEVEYLQQTLDTYLPGHQLRPEGSFCGLRVLPHSDRAAFFRSRDTQFLFDDLKHPRLAILYGGKLTDYRATAAQLVKRLRGTLGKRAPVADTAHLRLLAANRAA